MAARKRTTDMHLAGARQARAAHAESTAPSPRDPASHPASHPAFRPVKRLVATYSTLSLGTLAAAFVMRHHSAEVTAPVWVRATIVFATSLLMYAFAARAARGNPNAYLRLRIVSAVMLTAIVVIVALPGAFPVWLRIEQGACGLLLLGVVALANGRNLRQLFAK